MALKSFWISGKSSGRSTRIEGGPKVSNKGSSMSVSYYQANQEDVEEIVRIESKQERKRLETEITVFTEDGPQTFKINSVY